MFPYVEERFSDDEVAVLQRYFTNVYGPVFALVNLPEVVKGALFARYSRSPKSLRRLFLDEFVCDLEISGDASIDATVGMKRAEELYERVFYEYGDDSVAQVGGVHLACEQASNILTKVLEWGRLMAYLEQSTRYIGYDNRMANGHYRYHRPSAVLESALGARYVGDMDRMFDTYGELMPRLQSWLIARFPRQPGDSDFVHRQAVRAKALDGLRGLLPAASLSNVGIYGSGQSYESLLLKMRSHALDEARFYADLMLTELRKVIPSFLQRVDVSERGGEWSAYFADTRNQTARVLERMWPDAVPGASTERMDAATGEVHLIDFDPDGEEKLLTAICFAQTTLSEDEAFRRVGALSADERVTLLHAYVGDRKNRRHRPGRAFERTDYRFEIVVDYGAFRDLQRHRLLTVEWQPLTPELGYTVPDLVLEAGEEPAYVESLERSRALYDAMVPEFPLEAGYAVALAHRVRCVMQMNAREALHLIELRSGTQGHPSYRRIAQQMYHAIAEQAGHRAIADAMVHVDHGWSDLERLEGERRAESRRAMREVQNS
jgi:thymidylate synthase ThyX